MRGQLPRLLAGLSVGVLTAERMQRVLPVLAIGFLIRLALFCVQHFSEVQFIADYPVAEPAPVETSPVLEQSTLW